MDGRAYPLYWHILCKEGDSQEKVPKEGASNLREQKALVSPVLTWFSNHFPVEIVVVGDREFHSVDFAQWLDAQGVYYVLREKKNLQVKQGDGTYCALGSMNIYPGVKKFMTSVTVVKSKGFGQGNLAIYWKRNYRGKGEKEPWYLLSNLKHLDEVIEGYRKRMGIEAMFKDKKTGGYNLEECKGNIKRLNALILVIAIAYTVSSLKGKAIRKCGEEKYVGRNRSFHKKKTKNSNFKVGLYGQLFCDLGQELRRLGQVLMELTPGKRLFYWRGEQARREIEQAL